MMNDDEWWWMIDWLTNFKKKKKKKNGSLNFFRCTKIYFFYVTQNSIVNVSIISLCNFMLQRREVKKIIKKKKKNSEKAGHYQIILCNKVIVH